jgi:hypothetical protein
MPTLDSPADRAPRRRAAAAMAATCVLTVAVLTAACGGHDHDEATAGSGNPAGAVTASETGMAGSGDRADTDRAAPAAHSPGGTAGSTVTTTTTATAAETATAPTTTGSPRWSLGPTPNPPTPGIRTATHTSSTPAVS